MDPDPPISDLFVPLQRGTPPDGGVVAAAFCSAVGALWIATCLWMLASVLAGGVTLPAVAACLVGIALGVTALISQVPQLALAFWFRRPCSAVATQVTSDGHSFTFRYSQRAWKPTTAEVTCSLVLREARPAVTPEGQSGPPTRIDHLVASQRASCISRFSGDLLRTQCCLSAPADLARSFRLGRGALSWILKVRVRLPNQRDFWEEFQLPFEPEAVSRTVVDAQRVARGCFSVVMVRLPDWFRPEPTPEAVLDVAPHLHQLNRLPVRVMETLSRHEAERACRRLEAAGASVALYCDDELVTRITLHNLPIPQVDVERPCGELPIPLAVVEGEHPAIEPFSLTPVSVPETLRRAG